MSVDATTLRKLASLRLDPEQMAGVLEILAASAEKEETRKAAQRARSAKSRQKNITVTSPERNAERDAPLDKEKSPTPPKEIKPLPPSEPTVPSVERARKSSVRDELETILSPDMATAVIDHRKAVKAPLTAHSARLLVGSLSARGDPTANANLMIERGWRGFKPEWADNDEKRNHQTQRQTVRRGGAMDFAAGFLGVSPERADGGHGRGYDLGESRADASETERTFRAIGPPQGRA